MRLVEVPWLTRSFKRFRNSEFLFGTSLAVIVGMAAGLGAVFFRWLIDNFHKLFFDGGASILYFLGDYYVILLPVFGGIIIWLLIRYTHSREARGHGVPIVMEAVATRGGRIRRSTAIVKTLASSICIGSGGSVGIVGPTVQIGSAGGSTVAQALGLSPEWIKTMVACGAAGGISAAFNAPLAGIFFAHEVILGRIFTRHFGFVVIASVISDAIAHAFLGDMQSFSVPSYTLTTNWELALYFLLGIGSALVAVIFIWVLYKTDDLFEAIKIPSFTKPIIAGLIIGAIGLYYPYLFGVGYDGVSQSLLGRIDLSTLGILLVLKLVATSVTLGGGGSGGVFAPSLFLGAMFGGIFGNVANRLMPGITAPEGAYALVGMAAVFAGTARAPITAIIIVFEMTRNYAIMLPLMMAVVISTYIAQRLSRESIYTLKLSRRGIDVHPSEEVDLLERVSVADVMTRNFPTVQADVPLSELTKMFAKSKNHGFLVVDKDDNLKGIITLTDLEANIESSDENLTVTSIATTNLITAYPDESLHQVLHRMGAREIGRIPVVDRKEPQKMVGVLRRSDILRAYAKASAASKKDD